MKSHQVLSAAEQAVSTLLSLSWRRTEVDSKMDCGPKNKQVFKFFKTDGTVACIVEFRENEGWDEEIAWFGRNGKITDNNGATVLEAYKLLIDAKPVDHPLNDLFDMVWNKESGEPVSDQGKFPETIKVEKFIETVRA